MSKRFKPCSVVGCKGNAHKDANGARELCCTHYGRWKRHGNPLTVGTPPGAPLAFLKSDIVYDDKECVLWPFGVATDGYGQITVNGKKRGAHRFACERTHGPAPTPRHEAAHGCGNRACVNPRHLSWKTHSENEADKLVHDTHMRGERHNLAILTETRVREIMALKGEISQREISEIFGVARQTVGNIHRGITWAWLFKDAA